MQYTTLIRSAYHTIRVRPNRENFFDHDLGYKKLRQYFQSYKIQVVSRIDPLRYLFQAPTLTGRMSRWLVLLIEFYIEYITIKVIKGRAIVECLAQNAIEGDE